MWTIVDMENADTHDGVPLVGEQYRIAGRFATEELAVAWLDNHSDQDKVVRGGFGLDAPVGDQN